MNAAELKAIVVCPDGNACWLLPFGASLSMIEFSASVLAAARPSDFVNAHAPCLSCLLRVNKYALTGNASISASDCLSLLLSA